MADIRNDQYLHRPGAGRGAITPADPFEVLLYDGSGNPLLVKKPTGETRQALGVAGYGYDGTNWRPVKVNASGQAEVQLTGHIVKRTNLGSKWTFAPSEEWVLCEDYELGENTIRWGLFFKEHARPLHEVLENLAVNVSVYEQPGAFGRITGTFERTMYPALEDSPLHPLAIPGYDDQQSIINNIILYNKPFTYNLGRYLRISLINKSNTNMAIARAMLVEEGYQ